MIVMEKVFYANGFRVTMGPAEVQMSMHIESPVIDENTNQVIRVEKSEVADVRMSPYVAKLLLNALASSVENYEKEFGELKVVNSQE